MNPRTHLHPSALQSRTVAGIPQTSARDPGTHTLLSKSKMSTSAPTPAASAPPSAQASYTFRTTREMLDALIPLPRSEREKIKHIRLNAYPVALYPLAVDSCYTTHSWLAALQMLPGLRLELLTVEDELADWQMRDPWADNAVYWNITNAVLADGFREMHVILAGTTFMTRPNDLDEDDGVAQPEGWRKALRARDGEDSGADVEMHVAVQPRERDVVLDPTKRVPWVAPAQPLDPGDEPSEDDTKEVLVVIRRGRDANYVQEGADLHKDIKELMEAVPWSRITDKEHGNWVDTEDDPTAHL